MPKRLRRRLRKSVRRSLAVAFALVAGATASTASAHPSRDVAVALHGANRARQGDYPVYVATIRNAGHDPVTGIAVSFALPAGWTIRAVAASQGRCEPARTTCAVGSLAGDEAATVTLVLWAGSAERASVAASLSVGGDENASNDSAAHATVVTPSRCRMRVRGGPVRAGLPASVGVAVRLGANPVRGRRVVARGAGMSSSARTNARGVARLRVRSETPGALAISVPGLAGCRTRVQVTPAQ